jgi:hypothetical protein
MNSKLTTILCALLVITIESNCQSSTFQRSVGFDEEQNLCGELFFPAIQPDISTYFNKEWLLADLLLSDGRVITDKKIRYNCLLDEILWFEPETKQVIMLDKEGMDRFHFSDINGDSSVYFSKLKVEKSGGGYISIFAEELFTGKISLFVFHDFYFDRTEILQKDKRYIMKDVYKESPVFYIRFPDNKIVSLKKLSRSKILSCFPSYEFQIKQYMKEEGWNRTSKYEMKELFNYINSLYTSF